MPTRDVLLRHFRKRSYTHVDTRLHTLVSNVLLIIFDISPQQSSIHLIYFETRTLGEHLETLPLFWVEHDPIGWIIIHSTYTHIYTYISYHEHF